MDPSDILRTPSQTGIGNAEVRPLRLYGQSGTALAYSLEPRILPHILKVISVTQMGLK